MGNGFYSTEKDNSDHQSQLLRIGMYLWLRLPFLSLISQFLSAEKCHNGERQSPIDIVSREARYQEFQPFTTSHHENLSIRKGTLFAQNKGNTLKLYAVSNNNHTKALLGGGPLTVKYEFVEMHFHWGDSSNYQGSEHSIDGQKYPLELHMVHKNIHDESVSKALDHENGLAVLGFKFQVVEDTRPVNKGMETLAKIAKKYLVESGNKFSKNDFEKKFKVNEDEDIHMDVNVVNFLPIFMDEYFHYRGSLTTGGCEEAVNWIVFKKPLAIQEKHLKTFKTLKDKNGVNIENNFRPTQPVNDRPIYYHGISLLQNFHVDKIKQNKVITGNENAWLHSKKLQIYSNYILSVPLSAGSPKPAIMADKEDQKIADDLLPLLEDGSAPCNVHGKTYPHGANVPSLDGCNSCLCSNGQAVACTEKGCPDDCSALYSSIGRKNKRYKRVQMRSLCALYCKKKNCQSWSYCGGECYFIKKVKRKRVDGYTSGSHELSGHEQ